MNKNKLGKVHFIGVGGIGVSALARWFLAQKWAVSGSDIEETPLTRELKKEGVKVKIGHKKGNVGRGLGLAIYTKAAGEKNPEYLAAKRLHVPLFSYPQALGELTRGYTTVAIAGAHGKSTTTALLALVLIEARFDPTVIVGTKLREFKGRNFRNGKSPWLVIEADEYGRALLNYSPAFAIVTNIDREHLDTYRDLADIKRTFLKFLSQTRPGGAIVLNRDDKNLTALSVRIRAIAKRSYFSVFWYSSKDKAAKKIKSTLKIPGAHNVSNALAAYTLATKVLGIPSGIALRAISKYRGSWRRFEYRGTCRMPARRSFREGGSGVACRVYDDYAHHPTEIKATLKAFREYFPRSPIICVFQPHQAKRLALLFDDFVNAFDDAHALILLPLYKVAGRDKEVREKSSRDLAIKIQKRNPRLSLRYLPSPTPASIKESIASLLTSSSLKTKPHTSSPVLVMMGAGNIVDLTKKLLGRKKSRLI